METLKLLMPTLEYGDQVMAFKQECLDIGSSMDGCGPLRKLVSVTIPCVRTTTTTLLMFALIDSFKVFDKEALC